MALGRHFFQRIHIGGPGAGLGLAAAFQAHLVEQDFAQLLGRADIEILARQLVNFRLQPALRFAEIIGQTAQQFRVNRNAGAFHIGQHHHQRAFQTFVYAQLSRLGQLGLQQHMQAQGHIGVFGGIFGGFRHRHAIKADLLFALARHFAEGDGLVGEMQLRQFVHAVAMQAAFQHIGNQHRVIDRKQPDAAFQENRRVIFQILPHFQYGRVFQQRLQAFDDIGFLQLNNGAAVGSRRQIELRAVTLAVAAGNVTGLPRRHSQRDTAQPCLLRIQRSGFGINADQSQGCGAGNPGIQLFGRCDSEISAMINGRPDGGIFGACVDFRQFYFQVRRRGDGRGGGDGVHIADLEMRCNALNDGSEFHRLQEGDQFRGVGLVHRKFGRLFFQRHLVVQGHQPERNAGIVGVFDDGFAALVLLDLAGALQKRFDVAIGIYQFRRGLDPDSPHARHVVTRVAGQGLDLDHLVRGHAKLLEHFGGRDALVLHGVEQFDLAVDHQLHQVLVR